MATRGRQPIDLIWVLADLTNGQIDALLVKADTLHQSRVPSGRLSVNRNIDLTRAVIKIASTQAQLEAGMNTPTRRAILEVLTVPPVEMVSDPSWAGQREGGL